MDIAALQNNLIAFVQTNQAWAPYIVALLAFGESLAILSAIFPATVALIAIGAAVGATGLDLWPLILGGAIGAALGDLVSYEFGRYFDERVKHFWPLDRYPELVTRAEHFIQRFGVAGVFLGRFFGPLRALVPLVAGVFGMPRLPFQAANLTSALLWAALLLVFGDVMGDAVSRVIAWFRG